MPYQWTTGETITAVKLNALTVFLNNIGGGNTFITRASLPTARSSFASSAVGRNIYAVGGIAGAPPFPAISALNERFSLESNSWTQMASMATARDYPGSVSDGTYIYRFGGNNPANTNTAERYDPVANNWTSIANMGTGLYSISNSCVFLSGYAYVVGGLITSTASALNQRYDPVANTWSSMTALSAARGFCGAATDGTYIYAVGGQTGASATTAIATHERYNVSTNAWSSMTAMTAAKASFAYEYDGGPNVATSTSPFTGNIFAIGGSTTAPADSATNYRYNIANNSWTTVTALSAARTNVSGVAIKPNTSVSYLTHIFVIGGTTSGNNVTTSVFYIPPSGFSQASYTADQTRLCVSMSSSNLYNLTTGEVNRVIVASKNDVVTSDAATETGALII